MKRFALSLALALTAGCNKAPDRDSGMAAAVDEPSPAEVSADAKPAAFAQCTVCHSVKPDGKHGVGPNLRGAFDTRAGATAGFSYSSAMKASGLLWDEPTLDRYLTNPRSAVPGTKMAFAGMSDAKKRAEVIAYLKTLK